MTAQEQCDEWNAKYPVGTLVTERRYSPAMIGVTTEKALYACDGTARVKVLGWPYLPTLDSIKPYMAPDEPEPTPTLDDLIREAITEGKEWDISMFWNTDTRNACFGVEISGLSTEHDRWKNWSDRFRNRMRQLMAEAKRKD